MQGNITRLKVGMAVSYLAKRHCAPFSEPLVGLPEVFLVLAEGVLEEVVREFLEGRVLSDAA